MIPCTSIKENTDSTINTNNTDNVGIFSSCGSGKKFKKCCIDKVKDMLPYQPYITKSLAEYPKKRDNANENDFYTYYSKEYIKIDELMYKGMKRKKILFFIQRNKLKENDMDYKYLSEAYPLIKEVIEKNKFKTLKDYDDKVSIHFPLIDYFATYSDLLFDKYERGYEKYIHDFEELIQYFYDHFDLRNVENIIFIKLNDYFLVTKKYEQSISFFEGKLKENNEFKLEIYECLKDVYEEYYSYDEVIKKFDDLFEKEKDEELKEFLISLKMDFIDDEDMENDSLDYEDYGENE